MTEIDPDPPEADDEMGATLAMMQALGLGGTIAVGDLLDGHPDLVRRFATLDPVAAASAFGGLLTVPDLQSSAVRLEALVHLSVALGRGTHKPDAKLAQAAFRRLGDGSCGHMEDPAEDVFVGSVRSPLGNHRVLEGLWEGGAFHLQRFLDVLANMPAAPNFNALRASALALARLSDAVCGRAGLERYDLGEEMPVKLLPPKNLAAFLLRRRHLRFTPADLHALRISPASLTPFVFDLADADDLRGEALGASSLERRPLLREGDTYHLVLPTAVTSAIRYHVVVSCCRSNGHEVKLPAPAARSPWD
jgi:hypothetical protein